MDPSGRPEGGSDAERRETLWTAAGQFTGYGLTWALSVLLFLLGGWWVDGKLGTTPLMMILGAFLGAGAGFYNLYRHVVLDPRAAQERANAEEDDETDRRNDVAGGFGGSGPDDPDGA